MAIGFGEISVVGKEFIMAELMWCDTEYSTSNSLFSIFAGAYLFKKQKCTNRNFGCS